LNISLVSFGMPPAIPADRETEPGTGDGDTATAVVEGSGGEM
jgi:hypothetical protein